MKIVAIKQTASGHNIHFISDEYSEYTLDDLLAQGDKVALENVQVFKPKSGKESVRLKADKDKFNNLENLAITCNEGDYLFFDRHYLHLKARNGRTKKKWTAFSGHSSSSITDQPKEGYGPLPEDEYKVHFTQTVDADNSEGLWDTLKWLKKSPAWGLVATPLEQIKGNAYGRGSFYIHGGLFKGTAGCIEINGTENGHFHVFMRLYKRDCRLIVRYLK